MKKTNSDPANNVVGPRVYKARIEKDISQDALAGRLAALGVCVDRSAISRIESQERHVMDYEVAALARALKVKISWLYGKRS